MPTLRRRLKKIAIPSQKLPVGSDDRLKRKSQTVNDEQRRNRWEQRQRKKKLTEDMPTLRRRLKKIAIPSQKLPVGSDHRLKRKSQTVNDKQRRNRQEQRQKKKKLTEAVASHVNWHPQGRRMALWQDKLTSSRHRLSHLLENGDMSDVTFVVGNPPGEKEFKLHKLIISMCSDVFYTMFYGSLPEDNRVHIPDIEPDIFEIAMKYIYEESFSVASMEEAVRTYLAADKYNLADLKNKCTIYICNNISSQDVPVLYKAPHIVDLKIESKCKELISKNTLEILDSDHFVNCPLKMLEDMMEMESLNVGSEAKLFEYLLKWAKSNNCEKINAESREKSLRETMEPLLPHVYFLAMKIDEFLSGPGESNILTESEVNRIAKCLVGVICSSKLPAWCNKRKFRYYATCHANAVPKRLIICNDHCCNRQNYNYNQVTCEILLTTTDIVLRGVTFYGDLLSNKTSSPSLLVYSKDESESVPKTFSNITEAKCTYKYDANTELFELELINPITLSSQKLTTILLRNWNGVVFSLCNIGDSDITKKCQGIGMTIISPSLNESNTHFHEVIYSLT